MPTTREIIELEISLDLTEDDLGQIQHALDNLKEQIKSLRKRVQSLSKSESAAEQESPAKPDA